MTQYLLDCRNTRRLLDRRLARRESLSMILSAVVTVGAAAGFGVWAATGYTAGPAWIVMTGVLAVAQIVAQGWIRLWRCATREMQDQADTLGELLRVALRESHK